jgi:hypothetical protein
MRFCLWASDMMWTDNHFLLLGVVYCFTGDNVLYVYN